MQFLQVPEQAILTFEQIHGLRVTVHDLGGSLWRCLGPERFHHALPLCQAIKNIGHEAACSNFEVRQLRRDIVYHPQGRVHVCHAGLVEWVAPLFEGEKLEWVIFAGVRSPGESLRGDITDLPSPLPKSFWNEKVARPQPVEADEARLILEHLRQLAARLWQWKTQGEVASSSRVESLDALSLRRITIHRFIAQHHQGRVRLANLAATLGVSSHRASHAVRECCDTTFQQLLTQARVRTTMGLLRHSDLSVLEIALRAGFDDARQFHRAFRQKTATTPLQYRKAARAYWVAP